MNAKSKVILDFNETALRRGCFGFSDFHSALKSFVFTLRNSDFTHPGFDKQSGYLGLF